MFEQEFQKLGSLPFEDLHYYQMNEDLLGLGNSYQATLPIEQFA